MNEQTDDPAGTTRTDSDQTTPPPSEGPRVNGAQMRDLNRLRRSGSDRYIAGVAGGLGRHLDIDPTVVRVVLVVLTFFGGAGLMLYGALWLFVPEDGRDRAPLQLGPETRKLVLAVAIAIAALIFLGTTFSDQGWGFGFPVPVILLAVVAIIVLTRRDRRREGGQLAPPAPWDPVAAQQQAGMPPTPPAYLPPPRPRRTGLVLFWPTLAAIAIALGTLGILDASSPVTITAYAALALAITGVMLLIGAFVGRPGGLIALGLASSLALGITGIIGAATGGDVAHYDVRAAPLTSADVRSQYSTSAGSLELDLSRVSDVAALDGEVVSVHVNAGEITVLVPRGLEVHVQASAHFLGEIDIEGVKHEGFGQTVSTTLGSSLGLDPPRLNLVLDVRVGQITVQQR